MAVNNFHLSRLLGTELERRQLKLAVAESCTGGGLAYQLTAVPDSSAWFDCGFVTYSNNAKIALLGVQPKTLEQYGAVSPETAVEMAKCAIKQSNADLCLSITGIAGPAGGTAQKPVGLVHFGLADRKNFAQSRLAHFSSGRKHIRDEAVSFALCWLLEYINTREESSL